MYEKIFKEIFVLNRTAKRAILVSIDIILIFLCFFCAMYLRLDTLDFIYDWDSWYIVILITPPTLLIFIRYGLYRAIIRYISSRAIKVILIGCLASASLMLIVDQALSLPISATVPVIYFILMFGAISGVRFLVRTLYRHVISPPKENVIIYGAGHAGRQLLNSLDLEDKYLPFCFVDDNLEVHGREIGGIPIYNPHSLESLISQNNIKAVLLAIPNASQHQRRQIVRELEKFPVEVRTIPRIGDLISGRSSLSQHNVVRVDELLGRDPVAPDNNLMSKNIFGKAVLVTGAGGSIGSELSKEILRQKPSKLVLFDNSEYSLYKINEELCDLQSGHKLEIDIVPLLGTVLDKTSIENLLDKYSVDTIYHAAAYKHVPIVEDNVVVALMNNSFGTQVVVEAAIQKKISSFTLISTDKAVRATNIMGATKRIAELICQLHAIEHNDTDVSIVRFGNVLGSSGSVIPKFMSQIKNGGPVTVTDPEITRFFMTIKEAAQLVIQAAALKSEGNIFLLDMGEPVKILELVKRMVSLHGMTSYIGSNRDSSAQEGDIKIEFVGLRPGEKLHEELLIEDRRFDTSHPRIFAANETTMSRKDLEEFLINLKLACDGNEVSRTRKLLIEAPLGYSPLEAGR